MNDTRKERGLLLRLASGPGLRALHTYLTAFWFTVLFLFALTGFALNHGDWFGIAEPKALDREGRIDASLLAGPDRPALVRVLREDFDVRGRMDAFEVDDHEIRVRFVRPGYVGDAFIDRSAGTLTLHEERGNAWSALSEIHTGENAGTLGLWLIDVNALMVLLISVTGLAILLQTPARRRWGLVSLAAGGVLFVIVLVILF